MLQPPLSLEELNEFVEKYNVKQETWDSCRKYIGNCRNASDIDFAFSIEIEKGEIISKRNENFEYPYCDLVVSTLILKKDGNPYVEYGFGLLCS
jgi:hypothetical protein